MLSKQAIEEFQEIYLKTYGKALSFAEASEQAHQMIRLFKFVLKQPADSGTNDVEDDETGWNKLE